MRAASKCLSNVAKGGLRLTRVSAARFGHHIALGLSETFESTVPPAPTRVVPQRAPGRDKLEQRGGVEAGVPIDEASTSGHTDDGDDDSTLVFEPRAVTVYRFGEPSSHGAEANDRNA